MLSFRIAWRFLRSSLSQTILIALGIGVGVSVQVFIGSLITGLQTSLIDKTIGNQSQLTVSPVEEGTYLSNYEVYINDLESLDNVNAVAPVLETGAVLIEDAKSRNILVRGLDFVGSELIYDFNSKLVEGELPDAANEVLIGVTTFNDYKFNLNDTFEIYLPPSVGGTGEGDYYPVTIVGVFDLRITNLNNTWVITPIQTVRDILGLDNVVSKIESQVDQVFNTDKDAKNLIALIDDETIQVVDWKSQNAELLSGLSGQSYSSIMIQVFVTLSVVLGIASVLAITVLQKSKQIGILKAMGITNRKASMIFLYQGMILGILGAIIGISLGLGLTWSFTKFARNSLGEPIVPLFIDPAFISLSALIAFLSSSIASLLPARRSTKISIIEVIKNG